MSDTETNLPAVKSPTAVIPTWAQKKIVESKFTDNFTANELLLPWLARISGTSDFVKRNKPAFIDGAKIGDITDTLTLKLRSLQTVILVKYEVHYSTFKPGGGKLVKQWFTDRSAYDAARFPDGKDYGKKIDDEGNEVQETPMYYILMVDLATGTARPGCMGWGSTQAKKTKRVNALAREDILVPTDVGDGRVVTMPTTPPIYARLFDISTVEESNTDHAWIGWKADVGDLVWMNQDFGEAWYAKAEAFREQIEKGNVRPAPLSDAEEVDDTGGRREYARPMSSAEAAGGAATIDPKDLPF